MLGLSEKERHLFPSWSKLQVTVVGGLIVALVVWLTGVAVTYAYRKFFVSENQIATGKSSSPSEESVHITDVPSSHSSSASTENSSATSSPTALVTSSPSRDASTKKDYSLAEKKPLGDHGYWEVNQTFELDGSTMNNSLKGICYHACYRGPESIDFDLGKQYDTLTAKVGIYDKANPKGQAAILKIYLDNKEYQSYNLRPGSGQAQDIEIPVKDILNIRFEIDYGGDDKQRDYPVNLEVVIGRPTLHQTQS